MAYKGEFYKRAIDEIRSASKKRKDEYQQLLDKVYSAVPRLAEIDRATAKMGSEAVTLAFSGNTEMLNSLKDLCGKLYDEKSKILKSAGITEPLAECKLCNDTGYVGNNVCQCAKSLAKKLLFNELSQSISLDSACFEDFDLNYYSDVATSHGIVPRKNMTAVFKMAREYALNFSTDSKSLLFMGGVGLGKTHLSVSIIREVINKGFGVIYGSAQNLFSAAEKEHFSYENDDRRLEAMLSADLLVIDDLGTEFSTSYTQSVFYNIVNTRINRRLPTIINTNLTLPEIEEKYTARISSRLIGNYSLIKFFGNDIRQQKALSKK